MLLLKLYDVTSSSNGLLVVMFVGVSWADVICAPKLLFWVTLVIAVMALVIMLRAALGDVTMRKNEKASDTAPVVAISNDFGIAFMNESAAVVA